MNALANSFDTLPGTLDDRAELLEIGANGHWFRMNDFRVDISRRKPVARVLWALAEGARLHPGVAVSSKALIEAAWPGEFIVRHAAQIRLRVAIATLRASGLALRIVTGKGGYLLDGPIEIESTGPVSELVDMHPLSGVNELSSTEGTREAEAALDLLAPFKPQ